MDAISPNLPRRLGRYDIVGRLGAGGMAEILLGRISGPSGFERPVVIKRILPHLHGLREFVDMLLDEGRIAARIGHPNVVQVQELTHEREDLYLVMEYLEGEAASGLARRARARRLRLLPTLCAYIVAEACAGLHAAHELRSPDGELLDVVHRDVSPQNLFVGYDGTVKVLDFGIAKAAGRITRTEAGMLKGKFEYMSPEQARGDALDRRSDVFALGIVLYELSTQHRLFRRASHTETLRAVIGAEVPPPSEIDPSYPAVLEEVCLRALSADPADRYATAHDMRRDLLAALRHLPGPTMPEEALAALMRELFADRIEEKREMVSSMRAGHTPARVPLADVDEEELPTVEGRPRAEPRPPAPRKGLWLAVLAGAVAFAVALGVGLWRQSQPTPRAVAAEPSEATPPPPPAEVTIRVDSVPSGARLALDGEPRGTTPATLTMERSESPRSLRLEHDGYEPLVETVRPDVAQRLRLSMREISEIAPPPAPPTAPARRASRRRATPETSEPVPEEPPEPGAAERVRAFRRFD
ncbi:MAG: serine/threonine-protein kinase [Sandaracinaceae bacterium]